MSCENCNTEQDIIVVEILAGAPGAFGGPQGVQGATGSTGQQGPSGIPSTIAGPRGNTGATGPVSTVPGPSGATGPRGVQGESGPSGQSITGPSGPQGIQGVQGESGERGGTGPSGPQGPKGDTGERGGTGPAGASGLSVTGPAGPSGQAGPSGATGTPGATGQSITGPSGARGSTGERGATGSTGAQGPSGLAITGPKGDTGTSLQGPKGDTGVAGLTGASGQSIVGSTGATGAAITGATGSRGATGSTGPQGPSGQSIIGNTGASGSKGDTGERGSTGPVGASGLSIVGNTGASGLQGPSGLTITGSTGPAGATGASGQSDRYATTSSSSLSVTTGTKTFTVETNLSWSNLQPVVIANSLATAKMQGTVSSYTRSTGVMIAQITTVIGTGTFSAWQVNLDGIAGVAGETGPQGATGATGPESVVPGPSGATGATGPVSTVSGPSGATGPSGLQGLQGVVGDTGATGPVSTTPGPTGATGPQGDAGAGINIKAPVRAATTIGLNALSQNNHQSLIAVYNDALIIDDVLIEVDDEVLIKDQEDARQNGIYVVISRGAGEPFHLDRRGDSNTNPEIVLGDAVAVTSGTVNEATSWYLVTGGNINLGTTPLNWVIYSKVGATGATGQVGATGAAFTGATGPSGLQGATGIPIPGLSTAVQYIGTGDQYVFTNLGTAYIAESYLVTIDGVLQNPKLAAQAYIITSESNGTITFSTSPANGAEIIVRLVYGAIGATGPTLSEIPQTSEGSSFVVGAIHKGVLTLCENQFSSITITLPNSESIAIGSQYMFVRTSAGAVQFAAVLPTTILTTQGLSLYAVGSVAVVTKLTSTVWLLTGDLE